MPAGRRPEATLVLEKDRRPLSFHLPQPAPPRARFRFAVRARFQANRHAKASRPLTDRSRAGFCGGVHTLARGTVRREKEYPPVARAEGEVESGKAARR